MGTLASQITSLTIVYSALYSGADQSKHQSSASLAFVWRIHRAPVNSPHKWPVTWKMSPFDDVIMEAWINCLPFWDGISNAFLLEKVDNWQWIGTGSGIGSAGNKQQDNDATKWCNGILNRPALYLPTVLLFVMSDNACYYTDFNMHIFPFNDISDANNFI